jgi:hypothetical protein
MRPYRGSAERKSKLTMRFSDNATSANQVSQFSNSLALETQAGTTEQADIPLLPASQYLLNALSADWMIIGAGHVPVSFLHIDKQWPRWSRFGGIAERQTERVYTWIVVVVARPLES